MGRYRSLQSIMLAEALKGITDNQTIRTAAEIADRYRDVLELPEPERPKL